MARRRSPCFFKILLDASAPHLPLPPDFVSTHLETKIPKDPIVRSANGGYSWRLKIKKIGESYCFSDGWDCVVRDVQLGFGDFLVFRFDCKSTFRMVVFSPNGCEKDFPPKIQVDHVEDSAIVDDDDDDVDVDVDVEDEEIEDEDDDEEEEDDDEEEDEEVEYEEKDDGDDDEDDGDGDGGGDIDIDGPDGDPFFMVVFSKTHRLMMRLPAEIAVLAGIDGEGTLTVANLDGKEWELGVRMEKSTQSVRYCLSAGWREFRRGNDLSDGDECVFKFISSEDKLLLARVTKNKRPARKAAPASEVVKRKREKPERKSGKVPASKVETKAAREGGGGVKEVKRPRGRPAKQIRGNSTRRK